MINLLPPQKKEELRQEEYFRLTVILGVLAMLFLVCLSLLLFAIRVRGTGEIRAQEIFIEEEKLQQEESVLQKVRRLNADIASVAAFYEQDVVLSEIIRKISDAMPERMHIKSLHYAPASLQKQRGNEDQKSAQISLEGFVFTTEELLQFRRSLEKEPIFANFEFPRSNWNRAVNIDFSFSFDIVP